MVALRVVVPKVGFEGRRTVTVTSHQEGLLDSLLPHLVQQKGIFKVRSRTYSRYKLVLVFSEKMQIDLGSIPVTSEETQTNQLLG